MINKITLSMLLCAGLFATQSNAQMKLIAQTHTKFHTSGVITEDSTHYYHSGTKSSSAGKYTLPEFEFMADSIYAYKYNTTSKTLDPNYRTIFKYTGSDFNTGTTDSFKNGAWSPKTRARAVYVSGKPDTIIYESWSSMSSSWNASSRLLYTWSGNNVASKERQTYDYNKTTKKWSWNNKTKTIYTYNGSIVTEMIDSTWSGGSYGATTRETTTVAAGKPSQKNSYKWVSSSWKDDTRNNYTYDGSSRLVLDNQDIYTTTWEQNKRDTSIFIPGNNTKYRDTAVSLAFSFGNYINQGKWGFEYLADGRMTTLYSYSWDGVATWKQTDNQDSIEHWYYGYNVSVEEIKADDKRISVYPSPANNTINIALDGIGTDKTSHFAIFDMQGRLVKNWSANTNSVVTMSIDEMAAGNYILQVNDGTQIATRRFVVSK